MTGKLKSFNAKIFAQRYS